MKPFAWIAGASPSSFNAAASAWRRGITGRSSAGRGGAAETRGRAEGGGGEERDRKLARVKLASGPGQVLLDRIGAQHAVGDAEQIEEPGRDLAHQNVLGSVLALIPAPGHQQQRRHAV